MRHASLLLLGLIAALPAFARQDTLPRTPAPAGAKVYFISPENGDTVKRRFVVRFGLSGMGIAPAGVQMENTGHHHLLVDAPAVPPENRPIPNDAMHQHFGKGQTETILLLKPGKHTLQLLVGDHLHIQHKPPLKSEMITITVE